MSLRSVNLNLVPILQALLREQNVSRAAMGLGLTQPAVSAALGQLRLVLRDPLLVPAGRGMELTPRARALIPLVDEVCVSLARLWSNPQFDPATEGRCFVIASADYGPIIVVPPILKRLRRDAPNVSLRFVDLPLDTALKYHSAEIDFVISVRGELELLSGSDLKIDSLFQEDFVLIVHHDHRLAKMPVIIPADFQDEDFIFFDTGLDRNRESFIEGMADRFPRGRSAARVQHFSVMPLLALLTDAVGIIPRRVFDLTQPHLPLRQVGSPLLPAEVEICLAWHPRYEFDPAHRWFRAELKRALREKSGSE